MDKRDVPELKIDSYFKTLIPPLSRQEYLQLEQNILTEGCLDPIVTWRGIIIDGHNRYEICRRHNIPFRTVEMTFDYKEEVIAWICNHQLGRRNVTEETRKFLIGKQYASEKVVNEKRNALGINQYTYSNPRAVVPADPDKRKPSAPSGHKTAKRIGDKHHLAWNTVQKYGYYADAMEVIARKAPDVAARILSGQLKISHENLLQMAGLSPENIRVVMKRVESTQPHPFAQYNQTRWAMQIAEEENQSGATPPPSIKDMPKFDPDAELTSLTLTIPSWINTIRRAKEKTDLAIATSGAKSELLQALTSLAETAVNFAIALKEK